ncbi:MAG: hypothetical protein M1818_001685 [Claussenomyces sp. TS43310]|nr:MAG: hypothetical protein M1818_001685 [Claussenomyces sp. TS43310]
MVLEGDKILAVHVIRRAKLRHPDLPLMGSFLYDAIDGDQAARYLLQMSEDDTTGIKFSRFVEDWKLLVKQFYVENHRSDCLDSSIKRTVAERDNYRCCITGIRGRFWTALDMIDSLQQRLCDKLGAFTSPSHRDLLLSAKEGNAKNFIRNHWTLSKEAAKVFSGGAIRLESLGATKACFLSLSAHLLIRPIDHSNSSIDSPDPELLKIHCRFSRALKWTEIAADMERNPHLPRTETPTGAHLTQAIVTGFLKVWLKIPDTVRLQAYRYLKAAGSYLDGSTNMGVQRLSFGMYLKHGPAVHADRHTREYNALRLVRSRTSIPVPRPVDLILSRTNSFLVTSRMEGDLAGLSIDSCSDQEMSLMARDLRSWIAELNAMKMRSDSKQAISSASGGACLDYRINGSPVGPFRDERELSKSLRLGILPDLVHRDDHRIVFTHSDLSMRNILVKDGRISAIVDWENAGWYPEYWEYTKCHFGARYTYSKMVEDGGGHFRKQI